MELVITFVLYTLIIFVIAFVASRRTKSHADFILAHRQLGPWSTALGAGASDMGGWLVMALPGAAFAFGMNQIWLPIGLTIGAYFNWRLVAARLREDSIRYNDSQTIPTFFYNRFNADSPVIELASSLIILIFFTLYISSGFVSAALLMQSTFHWDYHTSLFVGAAIITVYSAVGGFLAVNWVDVFQGILMLVAFIIVAVIVMQKIGSFNGMHLYYQTHNAGYLNALNKVSWISCLSALGWGLGYFGQPHILVRFMAAKHTKNILLSRRICMTWMILCLITSYLIGLAGSVFFQGKLANPETVFLKLSEVALDPWSNGLLFSAILSAIMSTVAAQLISSCSTITEDLYTLFTNKKIQAGKLRSDRLTLFLIAFVALFMAFHPKETLLNLVGYAWAGFGASFGPVLLLSLYSKNITSKTAAIGMLTGAFVTIVWHSLGLHVGGIFKLYELIPGFTANLLLMMILHHFPSLRAKNKISV